MIQIRVEGAGDEGGVSLTALYRWFLRDAELTAHSELSLVSRPDPDAQGGAFDVINALINDGVGIGSLVLSYAAWRQAHRSSAKVGFRRGDTVVEAEDAAPGTLREIADALSVEASPVDPDAPEPPHQSDVAS